LTALIPALLLVVVGIGWSLEAGAQDTALNIIMERSCMAQPNKGAEASQWAKESAVYLNTTYPQAKVRVYYRAFGPLGEIHWIAEHENLAAFETMTGSLGSDAKWRALLQRGTPLFSGCEDQLLVAIP
jgi:hypothetical protein